ncbi:MAG: AAA family ATPase [Lachnospiraceae bacterium]|nr:AAA family ATPase [Lachnospiraceae bacterium]
MKKSILVICEPNEQYAALFLSYVNEHNPTGFDIHIFTDAAALKTYMKEKKVDVLLIAEEIAKDELSEQAAVVIYLSEGSVSDKSETKHTVNKFQSAEQILRQVCKICAQENNVQINSGFERKETCKQVGIFTPKGGSGKTTLAITLAQILGARKNVLVVNLEAFPGNYSWEQEGNGISTLMYLMKQEREDYQMQVQSAVYRVGNFDYLSGVSNYQDLQQMKKENMECFLDCLQKYTNYDVIIYDMAFVNESLWSVFERCDMVLEPRIEGQKSVNMFQSISEREKEALEDKVKKIILPFERKIDDSVEWLEQGKIGQCVKKFISVGEGIEAWIIEKSS